MELLTTYQFYFLVSRVEVGHVLVFLATIKREREDGDLHRSVVLLLILNGKTDFLSLVCDLGWLLFHFDFGLDLSLDLRFWFYRSHLFSDFKISTVFISCSRACLLDSFWARAIFFVFKGFVLVLGVSHSVGIFWIPSAAALPSVRVSLAR
jgi:hypothetical protein